MAKSNKKSNTEDLKDTNINRKKKRNKSIEKEILDNRKNKVKEEIDIDVINPNLNTKLFNFSKKFDNLKIKYKKNPKLFIAMIICLVFAGFSLIGSSYALLTYISKTGKVTTINAGTLALDFYNESDAITLNDALPQQDNDALSKNSEYTFTLKNNGSLNANYVVSLNNTCSTSKSYTINGSSVTPTKCIPDDYIKVGIKEGNKDYKVLSKKDNKFIIDSGVVKANNTKTYKMKIWLDWDTPNDYNATGNQVIIYSGKLGLEYEQGAKSDQPNAPELTENMIPVYYDETSSTWKKADSTNKSNTYKWYDYDNKMWANAVTVKENSITDSITENKSVSLSNASVPEKLPTKFVSGGYHINSAKSYTKITVTINTAGTFGFKATVSSESSFDKLTVTVSKNGGSATTVANAISGKNSNTYSDTASVGDKYVITASYTKDSSGNSGNDNGVLDNFTFPDNTSVSFTTSSEAGGTSGQDWTSDGVSGGTGVLVGDSITLDDSARKYNLNSPSVQTISSSLVGKYVCSTRTTSSCKTAYKIVEASSTITKVDEYKAEVILRSNYVKAVAGTTIPMDAINTMWVWIPRYTYTYLNTNTPEEIQIKFEKGTNSSGTISCSDTATGTSSTSETCTDTTNGSLKAGTSTYTHPAFWWDKDDDNVRESGEELTGIWVGKFEIGNSQIIKPNVTSWRSANVSTLHNGIYSMRSSGNSFGFKTTDETHMMKNMEWGAVTYLYHSKYGRCTNGTCAEVTINNCSSYVTGIGADTVSASSSSTSCTTDANKYNGEKGVLASTTGNVYGIYDMSGGAWEYMMGNMVNSSGAMYSSSSGFSTYPNKKYYDKYSYGTSDTEYTRGKLGDATKEMAPSSSSYKTWYSDNAVFPNSSDSWFLRGGLFYYDSYAGLFRFSGDNGGANGDFSARAVVFGALD